MSNGKHRCRHRRRRHRSVQMEAHKCLMYIVGCRIQSPNIYSGLSAVQTCETNKSDRFVLMTTRSSSLKHTYLYTRLSEMSWLRGPEFACRWFTFVTFSLQELSFTGNVCVRVRCFEVSQTFLKVLDSHISHSECQNLAPDSTCEWCVGVIAVNLIQVHRTYTVHTDCVNPRRLSFATFENQKILNESKQEGGAMSPVATL